MKKPDPLQFREAWLLFFILGIVMLNFPFLEIFNKPVLIFGFPLLFLYFIIGWPASIAVIFIFYHWLAREPEDARDKHS